MNKPHETPHEPYRKRIWLSLLGGGTLWAIHLMLVYPLTSLNCRWTWFPWSVGDLPGVKVVQLLATIIPLVLVAGLTLIAYREWRLTDQGQPREQEFEAITERPSFLAYLALLLNGWFILTIALAVVPILMIRPCG